MGAAPFEQARQARRRVTESFGVGGPRGTKRIGGVRRAPARQQPARCNRVARTVNSRTGDLEEKVVELHIVERASDNTIGRTLNRIASRNG